MNNPQKLTPIELRETIKSRYGSAAKAVLKADAAGQAGCCSTREDALYSLDQAGEVPGAAMLASLGCGNPTALAQLAQGETVLDLGSGGGIDVLQTDVMLTGGVSGNRRIAALADLQFSRKRIAVDVKKCLESAIANAENNHDLDVDELIVAQAHVGKALVIKRFHPRGRGRMGGILKPFSNLTIVVRQVESKAA